MGKNHASQYANFGSLRFIVTVAIVVYKGLIPVVDRILTFESKRKDVLLETQGRFKANA